MFFLRAVTEMQKLRLTILQGKNNLSRLAPLLSLVGLSGEFLSTPKSLLESVQQSPPDLVLIDRKFIFNETRGGGIESLIDKMSPFCPLLFVDEEEDRFLFADLERNQVFQLFDL